MADIRLSPFARLAWDLGRCPMARRLGIARGHGGEGIRFLTRDFLPFLRSLGRLVRQLRTQDLTLTHIAPADMPPPFDSLEGAAARSRR